MAPIGQAKVSNSSDRSEQSQHLQGYPAAAKRSAESVHVTKSGTAPESPSDKGR